MITERQEMVAKLPRFDISNEKWREYHYPNGDKFRVVGAVTLILEKRISGDVHRLIIKDTANDIEVGMYITPGWKAVSWSGHDGSHTIEF